MDYQIGYKPINRRRVTGEAVMRKIRYSKLQIIGAGSYGIVLTDGKYAIKVGNIREREFERLNKAAAVGFAVPALYYEKNVQIHHRILNVIKTHKIYSAGYNETWTSYVDEDGCADIMVSMLAKPYLDQTESIDDTDPHYKVAYAVAKVYNEEHDGDWGDQHPWNLGIYRGGLIILDI